MRRILILLMLGAGLAAGTVALADDDCDRPMRDWVPREVVERKAREMGIEVRRIRTDDGCYKVYGRTADGRAVEIEMDPVTLEILETEYRYRDRHGKRGDDDHDHDHDHDDDDDDDDDDVGVTPSPSTPPVPSNPLIGPATGSTN